MTDTFPEVLPHLRAFSCLGVEQAPSAPGLYAWYSMLHAGDPDWILDIVNGQDEGINRFRGLLERHTSRHESQEMRIEARGTFAQRWEGTLEETSIRGLRNFLSGETPTDDDEKSYSSSVPKLKGALDNPSMRKALLRILQVATPILASPLYIGVALDLRQRLGQHAEEIVKISHLAAKFPDKRKDLFRESNASKKFAIRAVASGFTSANLVVWTLNLETALQDQALSPTKIRDLAEAAEWLLNRWYRPALGKR